jgi:curved DNA-binding protein CbpA/serine/threonine protein kinase/serine/threonine protein phosphatase PrpC
MFTSAKSETGSVIFENQNFYEILDVATEATNNEIKKAYHKMLLKYHPDRNADNVIFAHKASLEIIKAYETLSKETLREQYDATLDDIDEEELFEEKSTPSEQKVQENMESDIIAERSPRITSWAPPSNDFQNYYLTRDDKSGREEVHTYAGGTAASEQPNNDFQNYYIDDFSGRDYVRTYAGGLTAAAEMRGIRSVQQDSISISHKIIDSLKKLPTKEQKVYVLQTTIHDMQIEEFSQNLSNGTTFGGVFLLKTVEEDKSETLDVLTVHAGDTLVYVILEGETFEDTEVILLTQPHNLAGGKRTYLMAHGHGLNVARGLGDVLMEAAGYSHQPEINTFKFPLKNKKVRIRILTACDGFGDFIDLAEIKELYWKHRKKPLNVITEIFMDFVYSKKNSRDNITIVMTDDEVGVLVGDGHGHKGEEPAQKATRIFFPRLNKKINDLLMLPENTREAVIKNFKEIFSLKKEIRLQQVAELCKMDIADHSLTLCGAGDFPRGESGYLVLATEQKNLTLLNQVESNLAKLSLSHSPQETYYPKGYANPPIQKRIIIPLNKIEELPPVFDKFLVDLRMSLQEYKSSDEDEYDILRIPKITKLPEEKKEIDSVKRIQEIYDILSEGFEGEYALDLSKLDRQLFNTISANDLQIKSFKKIQQTVVPAIEHEKKLALEEKKDSLISKELTTTSSSTMLSQLTDNKSSMVEVKQDKIVLSYIGANETKGGIQSELKSFATASGIQTVTGSLTALAKQRTKSGEWEPVVIKRSDQLEKTQMNIAAMKFMAEQSEQSPYVMKLKGILIRGDEPTDWLEGGFVMDDAELGTLDAFLMTFYKKDTDKIDYRILLKIAHDIAQGLAYLHKLNIRHADLRTEQIFLGENLNAKIGGFSYAGKFKNHGSYGNKQTVNPKADGIVGGMNPPEQYRSDEPLTLAADVYAFGMILREIFDKPPHRKTFAGMKDGYSPPRHFPYSLMYGRKEVIPEGCPPVIQEIIKKCWETSPENRPTADDLAKLFSELLKKAGELKLDFEITPPVAYDQRTMGLCKDFVSDKTDDREKLYDLLKAASLLTPQNGCLVQETKHAKVLAKELQVLLHIGLDSNENFRLIANNIKNNMRQTYPLARVINVLKICGYEDKAYYEALLKLSVNKRPICNILMKLRRQKPELCTRETFLRLINNQSNWVYYQEKLKNVKNLDNEALNKILDFEHETPLMITHSSVQGEKEHKQMMLR